MLRAMSEGYATRPVWRRPLATVLAVWMLLMVAAPLSFGRMLELAPEGAFPLIAGGLLAPAPMLLIWSFWTMQREPMTGWMAPSAMLAFAGGYVAAFMPLLDAGIWLNFHAHRPAYEAIVAETRDDPPAKGAPLRGWVVEQRDGISFRHRADRPGVIEFVWASEAWIEAGVRFNPRPCRATRTLRCVNPGDARFGVPGYFWFQHGGRRS